jgi:hypothetical protein
MLLEQSDWSLMCIHVPTKTEREGSHSNAQHWYEENRHTFTEGFSIHKTKAVTH